MCIQRERQENAPTHTGERIFLYIHTARKERQKEKKRRPREFSASRCCAVPVRCSRQLPLLPPRLTAGECSLPSFFPHALPLPHGTSPRGAIFLFSRARSSCFLLSARRAPVIPVPTSGLRAASPRRRISSSSSSSNRHDDSIDIRALHADNDVGGWERGGGGGWLCLISVYQRWYLLNERAAVISCADRNYSLWTMSVFGRAFAAPMCTLAWRWVCYTWKSRYEPF